MQEWSFFTRDERETSSLAASLAKTCRIGDCVLLQGDLGMGKTAFARGFIQALAGADIEVTSPTFTLVQTYPLPQNGMVWHYDLYRLKSPDELPEIGLDDALLQGITLIEWPEIAQHYLPEDALTITLSAGAHASERMIAIAATSGAWQERLHHLKGNTV